jgi:DNA-binding protein Fis
MSRLSTHRSPHHTFHTRKDARDTPRRLPRRQNPIDIVYALGNNPRSSSRGTFMPVPSSGHTVLLLTTDTAVHAQARQVFKDAFLTVVRDGAALQKELAKHRFDVVIMESRSGPEPSSAIQDHLDPSRMLLVKGSRDVLRKTLKMIQLMKPESNVHENTTRDGSLESYLEVKMGDFVRGMRNGSARNLHPILISAVERPLITSALRETRGNQIQAAELLGLNRNTLRKKIVELHIPVKQTKNKANRSA